MFDKQALVNFFVHRLCHLISDVAGVFPVLARLGWALSKNKIAIFADVNEFDNLQKMLTDSGLFKKKNICRIDQTSIKAAESMDLFVLHWACFKDHLDDVLNIKDDSVGLVVYAPRDSSGGGSVRNGTLEKMNSKHRNVTLVNFRGRLLQDIFVSMITTKRAKK